MRDRRSTHKNLSGTRITRARVPDSKDINVLNAVDIEQLRRERLGLKDNRPALPDSIAREHVMCLNVDCLNFLHKDDKACSACKCRAPGHNRCESCWTRYDPNTMNYCPGDGCGLPLPHNQKDYYKHPLTAAYQGG